VNSTNKRNQYPAPGRYTQTKEILRPRRCAVRMSRGPPNKRKQSQPSPRRATLSVASHATHSSILAARAPSSSVQSAITLPTPDNSRNFTNRLSHLGLANNTRGCSPHLSLVFASASQLLCEEPPNSILTEFAPNLREENLVSSHLCSKTSQRICNLAKVSFIPCQLTACRHQESDAITKLLQSNSVLPSVTQKNERDIAEAAGKTHGHRRR
jgi:hypothetical protein